jgi:hypothetical protein
VRDDFRIAVEAAALVADTALRLAVVSAVTTARFAYFTTFFVSLGASRRAIPAAATAPNTILVMPIVASEWFKHSKGLTHRRGFRSRCPSFSIRWRTTE